MKLPWRVARSLILALAVCGIARDAAAQPATQPTTRPSWQDVRQFVITPAAPPADALRHQVQVDPADRVDGDAAPIYLQALLLLPSDEQMDQYWKLEDEVGRDSAGDAEFGRLAPQRVPWLDTSMPPLIETAIRRDRCDWAIPLRQDNIKTRLPYLNHMRSMANLLNAKTRLALSRGELDQALRLIQAQSTLGSHVDEGTSVIIQELVAIGIQAQCMEMIQRVIERADGPNLYWALRQYPTPFGNLHASVETERAMMLDAFPVLRKARAGDAITADDWRQLVAQVADYAQAAAKANGGMPPDQGSSFLNGLAGGAMAFLSLPDARDYYARTRHLTPEQVEKIEPLRVVATYHLETYQQSSDAVYKWFALPYPQMLQGLNESLEHIAQQETGPVPMNLFRILVPALGRFAQTNARVDRMIAAFACVEAIRAYAAEHDGKLPPTLDAIADTPPPLNPVDGQAFDYTLNADGSATLGDDGKLIDSPLRYEIRLRK